MQTRVAIGLTSGILSGVDVFSFALARSLRLRGFDAHLLLTERPGSGRWPLPLPNDVPVVCLDPPPAGKPAAVRRHLERCAPCVYIPNYDVGASSACIGLSDGVFVAGIVHSDDSFHYRHAQRLGRYWDAIVAVSARTASVTAQLLPESEARLSVIPYGVELSPPIPRSDDGPLRIIYAGRLDQHQKRVLDLPAISAALRERHVDATLTIVGDGPERAALEKWIAGAGLQARVTLRTTMPHDAVLSLFGEHDVVLLTSAFEGLPLALLEAMAHGCVPVVSDVASGIPELIVTGTNGVRVPIGDAGAFAAAIAALAEGPELRRTMSAAARATIANGYTTEMMVSRYAGLFASMAKARFIRPKPTLAEVARAGVAATYHGLRGWGRAVLAGEEAP